MDVALGGLAGALGLFAVFGGIALMIWVGNKGETEKRKLKHDEDVQRRQLEHTERLKALEAGFPLPDADLAYARADVVRAGVAAAIGIAVPVVTIGGAVAATAMVLSMAGPELHLPVLCVIWASAGLVSLCTAVISLAAVASRRRAATTTPQAGGRPRPEPPPVGYAERITSLE